MDNNYYLKIYETKNFFYLATVIHLDLKTDMRNSHVTKITG